MAHSIGYVRRLLRELPADPERLLRSKRYRDPGFLSLFFEWLDDRIYYDPRDGLRWAKVAPELALQTPVEDEPEGHQAHRSHQVEAWVRLGGAHRACRDHAAADESYGKALKLAESGGISELVRADTDYRLSTLRACQGRSEEALKLASGAIYALRQVDDVPVVVLGQALVTLGYILTTLRRFAEAIAGFGEALVLACDGSSPAEERLHATAAKNLAMAISDSGSLADQRTALLFIRQAHRLLKGRVRCPERYRLFWVEGLIWSRTGSHAKAERLFRRALEGFEALRLPWEVSLVGLDLGSVLHLCGEMAELEEIARSAFAQFRVLSGADSQTLAALSLWVDAVKARSWVAVDVEDPGRPQRRYDGLHQKARQVILAGIARGACCKGKKRRRT